MRSHDPLFQPAVPHVGSAQSARRADAHQVRLDASAAAPAAPTQSGVNRLLGATAGPDAGNVRAILAILLTVGFLGILAYLCVALVTGHEQARDLVMAGFGALVAAFTAVSGFYIGRRSADS